MIVDDTPEAIILSGFDPVRREVARLAMSRLITDGRIHPARIEKLVSKAHEEVEKTIKEAGEQAIYDAGVRRLHPDLVKLLGRKEAEADRYEKQKDFLMMSAERYRQNEVAESWLETLKSRAQIDRWELAAPEELEEETEETL